MFGYVQADVNALSEAAKPRYEAYYCGLCRALKERYGELGQMTLSYDMAFLWMILSGLYEPEEKISPMRCLFHPVKTRARMQNGLAEYVADMNILLAYHKCRDDKMDEGGVKGRAGEFALRSAYKQVKAQYPAKCEVVGACMDKIAALEKEPGIGPDALANLTGVMLGEIYACRDDVWAPTLRRMGEALGRFIYYMDAYDDYESDVKKGRFTPLKDFHAQADYEELMQSILKMMVGQCAQAFEELPIERDVDIVRNVLYRGVWQRYAAVKAKKAEKSKEHEDE